MKLNTPFWLESLQYNDAQRRYRRAKRRLIRSFILCLILLALLAFVALDFYRTFFPL